MNTVVSGQERGANTMTSYSKMLKIAVIGGGASGMATAIVASEYAQKEAKSIEITIFEHNNELGKKILATGNGRCNLGHMDISPNKYHTSQMYEKAKQHNLIISVLNRFTDADTISFFGRMGLWIWNSNGYLYPKAEQASTVRDILIKEVSRLGVRQELNSDISVINHNQDGTFTIINHNREMIFDRIVMACGSYAGIMKKDRIPSDKDGYSLAYHLGHTINKVKPALCAIECGTDAMHRLLKGVKVKATVTLYTGQRKLSTADGEVLFTEYGISGIAVFDISHGVDNSTEQDVHIRLKMDDVYGRVVENADDSYTVLKSRIAEFMGRTVGDMFAGMMNSHLAQYVIEEHYELSPDDVIDGEIEKILLSNRYDTFVIKGPLKTRKYENAQVCRGGISLGEISDSMESKVVPGVFFTGEMMDVDACCGGYNLHWAWATANIAGKNVLR